jgi:hypothetical protein
MNGKLKLGQEFREVDVDAVLVIRHQLLTP